VAECERQSGSYGCGWGRLGIRVRDSEGAAGGDYIGGVE
jgi:hypothetical protein